MNIKVMFSDLVTNITIANVAYVKEEGSCLNFYTEGTSVPIACCKTVQIAYWQKI